MHFISINFEITKSSELLKKSSVISHRYYWGKDTFSQFQYFLLFSFLQNVVFFPHMNSIEYLGFKLLYCIPQGLRSLHIFTSLEQRDFLGIQLPNSSSLKVLLVSEIMAYNWSKQLEFYGFI